MHIYVPQRTRGLHKHRFKGEDPETIKAVDYPGPEKCTSAVKSILGTIRNFLERIPEKKDNRGNVVKIDVSRRGGRARARAPMPDLRRGLFAKARKRTLTLWPAVLREGGGNHK
jgi:hypothetical protein